MAGAIPLVRLLNDSLAGERIVRVMGIVNGTTNYMLTSMSDEGCEYATALAEAQALGYAEADPTADVEGLDARAKAAILAGIAFDADVVASDVHTEGITAIGASDIAFAHKLGYAVKLLAVAERVDGGAGPAVAVRVHPAMVPHDHPLASVRGAFNAVFVEGDTAGELMVYGRGAGGTATASAVLGDVVAAAHHLKEEMRGRACSPPAGRDQPDLDAFDPVLPGFGREGPARGPGVGGAGVRRAPRLDPFHGTDRPRRRGPARVHHPHRPGGRRAGDPRLAGGAGRRRPCRRPPAGHRARTLIGQP